MSTTLLWIPDSEYSHEYIASNTLYYDEYENSTMKYIVEDELKLGDLIIIKGKDIFTSLHQFSEHHDGSKCEIVVSFDHVLDSSHICPTKILSSILELGFNLFGSKFNLRLV